MRRRAMRRTHKPHDLRGQYAAIPSGPDLATTVIDDPYGPPSDAQATHEQRGAGAEREWVPPPRPQIVVVRSFRHDPLGRMHARRQVTDAEYYAGRAYQTLVETSQGRSTRSCDLDGGGGGNGTPGHAPVSDEMLRAGRRLRATDARLRARYGTEGLDVTRAVLIAHRRLDQMHDGMGHGARFWGFLLRRCLDEVAMLLGLANKPR